MIFTSFLKVFPTPVGVFLPILDALFSLYRLPHARGGVSSLTGSVAPESESSPRPWGCFCPCPRMPAPAWVFPTPVGVFRRSSGWSLWAISLPHARGGVSAHAGGHHLRHSSSPRPWGCFHFCSPYRHPVLVFPTPVGVFLLSVVSLVVLLGLPHARGGVSIG